MYPSNKISEDLKVYRKQSLKIKHLKSKAREYYPGKNANSIKKREQGQLEKKTTESPKMYSLLMNTYQPRQKMLDPSQRHSIFS